jgi:NDP-sugar pyrophosphorylase family protein
VSTTGRTIEHAGVIAAGRGERLRSLSGTAKVLARVHGQPLAWHIFGSLREVAPAAVTIIINDESTAVRDQVMGTAWPFDVRWIVETTPSSMHSFLRVVESMADGGSPGPFLVSTVDTVAVDGAFSDFVARAGGLDADVVLAVKRPVAADDRPLLLRTDARSAVVALGSDVTADGSDAVWATAGVYLVRATVLAEARQARADGLTALRAFLGRLCDRGYRVAAVPIRASVDVDRPEDLAAAETLLNEVHS